MRSGSNEILVGQKVRAMKRIANTGIMTMLFFGALGSAVIPAVGQTATSSAQSGSSSSAASSGQSLGDYAKQIRKGSAPASKPKVFDNDNLPKEDKLSVVGNATQASSDNSVAAKTEDTTAAAGADAKAGSDVNVATAAPSGAPKTPEEEEAAKQAAWKQWGAKVQAQKDQVDLLGRELDVLQREYQIRAAAMYADVGNRLRNSGDWDKQDADYKQKIADKQKSLDDAKQKLDDIQEDARKAGVPASVREPQ
jgi:hypothetical protein